VISAALRSRANAPRGTRLAAHLRAKISWHDYLRGIAMSTSIVRLDGAIEAEISEPPAERLIAGAPELQVRNYFTDRTQQFFAGRWSATRGKWQLRYTENELCVMTAGKVVIESTGGERMSFAAGDAFVIPAGFTGTWEVLDDCAKVYAIFEARG
jgi:uncharacterized protein